MTSILEKHFQSGMQIILTGICIWMASTVQTSSIKIAELAIQVTALQQQIMDLKLNQMDMEERLFDLRREVK